MLSGRPITDQGLIEGLDINSSSSSDAVMATEGHSPQVTLFQEVGGGKVTPSGLKGDGEDFKKVQYDFVFDFLDPGEHYQTGQLSLEEATAALR